MSDIKKEEVSELLDANLSLNRQNRLLWTGLIGLAAVSVLSINSCSKNANALSQARSEMGAVQQKVAALTAENAKLKDYADTAQNFSLGIRPWYDENDFGCEDPKCAACDRMEKENKKKFVAFTNAVDTLNINPKVLERLQKGVE